MKAVNLDHIEVDQGVDHKGRTFGYDHYRNNFITWNITESKIVVGLIEHDALETRHGSKKATERDARRVVRRENAAPNSLLRRAILRRFQRD